MCVDLISSALTIGTHTRIISRATVVPSPSLPITLHLWLPPCHSGTHAGVIFKSTIAVAFFPLPVTLYLWLPPCHPGTYSRVMFKVTTVVWPLLLIQSSSTYGFIPAIRSVSVTSAPSSEPDIGDGIDSLCKTKTKLFYLCPFLTLRP